jgi:hypothetical protein
MQLPIPTTMDIVFPYGAYVTTDVQAVSEYKNGQRAGQKTDEASGLPLWEVTVMDADEGVRGPAKSVKVTIAAKYQPVPPEPLPNTPFRPVEFGGLLVRPYAAEVMGGRWKVAYSIRATEMRAPSVNRLTGEIKPTGKTPAPAGAGS